MTHRSQAEVVRPSHHHAVELSDLLAEIEELSASVGPFADLTAEPLNAQPRRARTQIGTTCLRRPAAADRVAEGVEGIIRKAAQPGLRLVDRQLEPSHD